MESKVLLALSVSVLVVLLSKLIKSVPLAKPKLNLPPGPWMLPVIGSLHHLVTSRRPHHAMRLLSKEYGPIMMLRLGEVPALVLSSPEAAQEVLKTNDLKFADRNLNPTLYTFSFNGTDLTFAPYGERWRQLRKISVMELLNPTPARVLSYRHIREEEVASFLQNLTAFAGTGSPVNLTKMISNLINDTFVRQSVGSRCKYQDEYLDAFQTSLRQTSSMTVADLFPSSRVLQFFATAPRKVLASRIRMQRVLKQIIQEKTEAIDRGDDEAAGQDCFLGVLIRLQKERSTPIPLTEDTIVALMFVSPPHLDHSHLNYPTTGDYINCFFY
jgi:cytochrome P450